jgi:hypothetical protein
MSRQRAAVVPWLNGSLPIPGRVEDLIGLPPWLRHASFAWRLLQREDAEKPDHGHGMCGISSQRSRPKTPGGRWEEILCCCFMYMVCTRSRPMFIQIMVKKTGRNILSISCNIFSTWSHPCLFYRKHGKFSQIRRHGKYFRDDLGCWYNIKIIPNLFD